MSPHVYSPLSDSENTELISFSHTSVEKETPRPYFERSQLTRKLCIAGLSFSWAVSIFCIAFGAFTSRIEYEPSVQWESLSDALILAQTAILTLCQEALGYIHTVSLRWALQRDGKLEFNSNLRLWQNAKMAGPNAWYGNLIVILGQVSTFGTSALTIAQDSDSGSGWLWFLGEAWIILGIGIGMQASVATWALLSQQEWPTWSSNPMDVAAACLNQSWHPLVRRHGRSMQGLDEISHPAMSMYPSSRQVCAYESNKDVRRLTLSIWIVFGLCCIWTAAVLIATAIRYPSTLSLASFWNPFGFSGEYTYIPLLNRQSSPKGIIALDFLWLVILICAMQSVVTLATHCAELHVNLSRDETTWRQASRKKGLLKTSNALTDALSSHESMILLVLKIAIQWFYSLTFSIDNYEGIFLKGAQIMYMTVVVAILALFATFLVLSKPKGPQPATFGHLQTLVDLVDEWPGRADKMYWGDKGWHTEPQLRQVYSEGIRHAGTSKMPLEPIKMTAEYA